MLVAGAADADLMCSARSVVKNVAIVLLLAFSAATTAFLAFSFLFVQCVQLVQQQSHAQV